MHSPDLHFSLSRCYEILSDERKVPRALRAAHKRRSTPRTLYTPQGIKTTLPGVLTGNNHIAGISWGGATKQLSYQEAANKVPLLRL